MSERPSPSSIAVCALIALFTDESSPLHTHIETDDTRDELFALLQELTKTPVAALDSVFGIVEAVEGVCGESVASLFVDTITRCCETSIDGLVDLMASLQSALLPQSTSTTTTIDPSSQFGLYVRRVCLGFDKLPFQAVTRLGQAIQESLNGDPDEKTTWKPSTQQLELVVGQQAFGLEHQQQTNHGSLEQTEKTIDDLLRHSPESPALYFLRFLYCLQNGERVGAIHALHQYFDYALIHGRKQDSMARHNILHYASLLLAATYDNFGDKDLSATATEEAIHIAQQNGESAGIAYAMSMIYRNQSGTPSEMEDILQRTASRAQEGQLRPLLAGSKLALSHHLVHHSKDPTKVWESLLDASTDRPVDSSLTVDRPTHLTDLLSNQHARRILGLQSLTGAGVWQHLGFPGISGLHASVGLDCYGSAISQSNRIAAEQSIAMNEMCGPMRRPISDDPMAALESIEDDESEHGICRYGVALRRMLSLDEQDPRVSFGIALVLHEWAVRRGEYPQAEALIEFLLSSLHPRMPHYTETQIEVSAQHALLLARQGHYVDAQNKLEQLCRECQKQSLKTQHASLLLQLALVHLDVSPSSFVGAVSPTLDCLTMTEELSMDTTHATALSILAKIHLRRNEARKASSVLRGVLPTLLQNTHVWFAGEAYLTLAKSLLKQEAQPTKRHLENASEALRKSRTLMEECQDVVRLREICYLQARIFADNENQAEERDAATSEFVALSRHLSEFSHSTWKNSLMYDLHNRDALEQLVDRPVP